MLIDDAGRARVADAIAAAESNTSGEIVVVLASEAEHYPATALAVAILAAFSLPLLAGVLGGWRPDALLPMWELSDTDTHVLRAIEAYAVVQAAVFVLTLAIVHYGGLARVLTPRGLRRDRVHRRALAQFKARGIDRTAGRTGVLFYIAEPERIAEVIADDGIFEKVTPDHWATTITALVDGVKTGRAADGIVTAIGLAGAVLAAHCPPGADNPNELPDRLIEI
jgi:putative membrane protein